MRFNIQKIPLHDINSNDTTYRITTTHSCDNLSVSIQAIGLLNLPFLLQSPSGYIIVSGFLRVKACHKIQLAEINARIIDADTPKYDCVKIAIADNSFQRPLNLIEQARAFKLISCTVDNDHDIASVASESGLPSHKGLINKILKFNALPEVIQEFIVQDSISLNTASELCAFNRDIAVYFATLFSDLNISFSNQKEILTMAKEISIRDGISIDQFIEMKELNAIVSNDDLDRNQKCQKIRQLFNGLRYPNISQAEIKMRNCLKDLKLGSHVRFVPPKDFEGTDYFLNMRFKNLAELNERKKTFDQLVDNPLFKKIIDKN